ncbi:MAG: hypothetical protein ACC635_06305 [Acidiferrobacterales bacterium]
MKVKIKVIPAVIWLFASLFVFLFSPSSNSTEFEFLDINEGELEFITRPLKETPHHHSTHISITNESIKSGWIGNKQCHSNLQAVPAMEIVFRKGYVRNLDISRSENIGRVWIEGASVQLKEVKKNAVVCITSETLSFKKNGHSGNYIWTGGPYMKKYLDGYFPMKVSIAIDYPSDKLVFEKLYPHAVELKAVKLPGHIRLSLLFEGILELETHFREISN